MYSLRHSMSNCRGANKSTSLSKRAPHVDSLHHLKHGSSLSAQPSACFNLHLNYKGKNKYSVGRVVGSSTRSDPTSTTSLLQSDREEALMATSCAMTGGGSMVPSTLSIFDQNGASSTEEVPEVAPRRGDLVCVHRRHFLGP